MEVWDLPTRVFHWSLVAGVGVGFITGFIAPEWWMGVHKWSGYAVVALIAFRVVWGLFGPEYSRFDSLVRTSLKAGDHLRGLLLLRPVHAVGHTPLGALMIIALAIVLICLTTTGLLVLGGEEKQGPLAGIAGYATGSGAKPIHELLAWALLALIGGHVLGVVVESMMMRANLVTGMITGRKRLPAAAEPPAPRPARPWPAALIMAALVIGTGAGLVLLGRLPPTGWRQLAENPVYVKECGACHEAYHPSLLPAQSWGRLMSHLSDHFGEDASIGLATASEISDWLMVNAAETWDTEAANRLRIVDPGEPLRITRAPYSRRKHADLADAVFARKAVRSRANCSACHHDAAAGRFDDQAIAIPKEVK